MNINPQFPPVIQPVQIDQYVETNKLVGHPEDKIEMVDWEEMLEIGLEIDCFG